MQLLDSEQLELAFHLHKIDGDVLARQFYGDLWSAIQRAEKIREPKSLSGCEDDLRQLCQHYFAAMRGWRENEQERHESASCCAPSLENAREAYAMLPTFEKQFYRYALCYLELNRLLIHMRGKVSRFAQGTNIDTADVMKVNHHTGAAIWRIHADRLKIMEKRCRLERVRLLLRQFDPLMESLGAELPRLPGRDGDRQLTLFKAALRQKQYDRARGIVLGWKNAKVQSTGMRVAELAQQNESELTAAESLMLHSGELSLIFAFLKDDEARINRLLEKFNVPYMVFQYRNLLHLGYLLGKIGSIEGLIICHAKLLSLSARPHDDPAYAKVQEQAVLAPARALLQQKFRTMGAIFDGMETTVAILEKLFAVTEEYKGHTSSS